MKIFSIAHFSLIIVIGNLSSVLALSAEQLEPIGREIQDEPKYIQNMFGIPEYECVENTAKDTMQNLAYDEVYQPKGLNLTSIEKNIPLINCLSPDGFFIVNFLGRSPENYKITPDMKLVKPLVFLQLSVDMHWTISVIGDLILCGKDIVEKDVRVWYEPERQGTLLEAKSPRIMFNNGKERTCLYPPRYSFKNGLTSLHSKITEQQTAQESTQLRLTVTKDDKKVMRIRDRHLTFTGNVFEEPLARSVTHHLDGFWIEEISPLEYWRSMYYMWALYPRMKGVWGSIFLVLSISFSKVFFLRYTLHNSYISSILLIILLSVTSVPNRHITSF